MKRFLMNRWGPFVLALLGVTLMFLAALRREKPESKPLPENESPPVERGSVTPPTSPPEATSSPVVEVPAHEPQTNRPRPSYSLRSDDDEPGNNVLSWDRMKTNPQYAVRVDRHMAIKHLLSSDAPRSPEGKQIIALCRAFGYEPWTVSAAYTIAWEYAKIQPEGFYPPDRPNFELIGAEARAAEIQYDLGFNFAPEFLEQIKQIRPVKEFGRNYGVVGITGEPLLDETTWADVPAEIATL